MGIEFMDKFRSPVVEAAFFDGIPQWSVSRTDGTAFVVTQPIDRTRGDNFFLVTPTGAGVDLTSMFPADHQLQVLARGEKFRRDWVEGGTTPVRLREGQLPTLARRNGVRRVLNNIAELHFDEDYRRNFARTMPSSGLLQSGLEHAAIKAVKQSFVHDVTTRLRNHGIDIAPGMEVVEDERFAKIPKIPLPEMRVIKDDRTFIVGGTRTNSEVARRLTDLGGRDHMPFFTPVDSIMFEKGEEQHDPRETLLFYLGDFTGGFRNVADVYVAMPLTTATNAAAFHMSFNLRGHDNLYHSGQYSDATSGRLTLPPGSAQPEGWSNGGEYVILSSSVFYEPYTSVPPIEEAIVSQVQPSTGEMLWSRRLAVPHQT